MVKPDVVGLAMEHLLGERLVVLGGPAVRLEGRDGLPLPASLADLRARVDDGGELVVGEVRVEHVGPGGLRVGHKPGHARAQDAPCGRGHAQRVGDGLDGADREGGAAHDGGVELHRHDHHAVARSGQVGVEGEALHRGAAVDDADVVVARAVVEREAKALLAQEQLVLVDEFYGRGHDGEPVGLGFEGHVADGRVPVEELDGSPTLGRGAVVEPEEVRGGRLRIQVYQERPQAPPGVDGGEVDRSGGLSDPALVVRYRERPHASSVLSAFVDGVYPEYTERKRSVNTDRSPWGGGSPWGEPPANGPLRPEGACPGGPGGPRPRRRR